MGVGRYKFVATGLWEQFPVEDLMWGGEEGEGGESQSYIDSLSSGVKAPKMQQ